MGIQLSRTSLGLTALRGLPTGLAAINSAQALAAAMGFGATPEWMVKGNESTGATDLVGSDDLTDVNTPTHDIVSAFYDDKVTEMSLGSTDAMQSVANGTCRPGGNESFLFVWVGSSASFAEFGSDAIAGNRNSVSPFHGWELLVNGLANGIRYSITNSTAEMVRSAVPATWGVVTAHPYILACGRDESKSGSDVIYLMSNEFTETRRSSFTGTMGTTENFALGDVRALGAANFQHGLAAYWSGTDSEGIEQENIDNLARFLGL